MENIVENSSLRNATYVFKDRREAGILLAGLLTGYGGSNAIVLAIPSGGVPVAHEIQRTLSLDLDLIIVRKAQIPWNPEAGFGAVNLDGDVMLNRELIRLLKLSDRSIDRQIKKTVEILKSRDSIFRQGKAFPDIRNRTVILIDDGLASGYTMRAAVTFVKKRTPAEIIIAVPTGSCKTLQGMSTEVDSTYCLNIREGFPFAVADAYRVWHDLTDEDVLDLLKNA